MGASRLRKFNPPPRPIPAAHCQRTCMVVQRRQLIFMRGRTGSNSPTSSVGKGDAARRPDQAMKERQGTARGSGARWSAYLQGHTYIPRAIASPYTMSSDGISKVVFPCGRVLIVKGLACTEMRSRSISSASSADEA